MCFKFTIVYHFIKISTDALLYYLYLDNEELNIATLLRVMGEVNSQWDKIAEKLGFKQFLKGPISAKSFLEGWHKFAQTSQPSWKQLGIALSNYKQKAEQIKQNAGEYIRTHCKLIPNSRKYILFIFISLFEMLFFQLCITHLNYGQP